jgi:hypothetical protein
MGLALAKRQARNPPVHLHSTRISEINLVPASGVCQIIPRGVEFRETMKRGRLQSSKQQHIWSSTDWTAVSRQRSGNGMAMKPRLYLETTVPSYLVSKPSRDLITAAHQQLTHEWWETRLVDFDVYVSQFVLDEASAGDADMAANRVALLGDFPVLDATSEALRLARALVERGVIPPRKATDAAHIAIATIHHMQFLMTWNCAHLANAEIMAQVQAICAGLGYATPIVCTPEELLGGQDDPMA